MDPIAKDLKKALADNPDLSMQTGSTNIRIAYTISLSTFSVRGCSSSTNIPYYGIFAGFLMSLCLDILVRWRAHSLRGQRFSVPSKFNINETNTLPQCFTDYQPRMKNSLAGMIGHYCPLFCHFLSPLCKLPESIIKPMSSWSQELAFFDKAAVDRAVTQGIYYLLAICNTYIVLT